jgi:DcmR-like sensory protein
MCQEHEQVKMGFTKQTFPAGTHMCLIYSDEAERQSIISKFIDSGLVNDEKVSYFADTATPAEVRQWLANKGVELPEDQHDDRFGVLVAEKTYCPTGEFIPESMLDTLRTYYKQAIDDGYPGARVSGEMAWALRGIPGSDRLMEYEALINNILAVHPVTAICQYDANRFDGATILDVLKVHPMMIVHGQILRNPYYLKPEVFMKDFSSRT